MADSQVILVVDGGRPTDSIVLSEAAHRLRFTGDGVDAIFEIDRSACPAPNDSI